VAISDELAEVLEPSAGGSGDVQVFFDQRSTLIRLSGQIDLALGPELEDAGRDAIDRGEQVHLDVSRVSFIDSIGVGFIARLASAENAVGRRLAVSGADRRVRETLILAGLVTLLDYSP
jgi:anti-sigma B factor antagonist